MIDHVSLGSEEAMANSCQIERQLHFQACREYGLADQNNRCDGLNADKIAEWTVVPSHSLHTRSYLDISLISGYPRETSRDRRL